MPLLSSKLSHDLVLSSEKSRCPHRDYCFPLPSPLNPPPTALLPDRVTQHWPPCSPSYSLNTLHLFRSVFSSLKNFPLENPYFFQKLGRKFPGHLAKISTFLCTHIPPDQPPQTPFSLCTFSLAATTT